MPTPLAYFGYPLNAGSDGLGKPPELTDLLPVYGQGQYHRANQKAQRTTQLTPVVMGANGAQRSWRPVDHLVKHPARDLRNKPAWQQGMHEPPSLESRYVNVPLSSKPE